MQKTLREFLYTPIEEAIGILHARQKQQLAIPFLDVPEPLRVFSEWENKTYRPTAVMFRQSATPNFEMDRVLGLCEKYQLDLLILTFQEDKFSPNNNCKYALARMGFFEGLGRQGGKKISYSTILNFNQYNGLPLGECKTFRGQPFMEFHHGLLMQEFPQISINNISDISEWFIRNHIKTGNLYQANLKLFLKHAILFETFVLSGSELNFTLKKVVPAFQEIIDTYGIKPLIVNSEDPDMEGDDYWQLYPKHLHQFAPYDRRKTPRYEAPFDKLIPAEIKHKKWTIPST
ncbi:hypothetical protein [Crenothrix sp.]|uniref:hypothetical protein n=1 Tax=Crenothrix sp. TaxID=3100433 RepID=UPI00374CAD4E